MAVATGATREGNGDCTVSDAVLEWAQIWHERMTDAVTAEVIRSCVGEALKYHKRNNIVIIMGNEVYVNARHEGVITGDTFDCIPIELSGEVPSRMLYVVRKDE